VVAMELLRSGYIYGSGISSRSHFDGSASLMRVSVTSFECLQFCCLICNYSGMTGNWGSSGYHIEAWRGW